jgi:hypothetical protein
MTTLTLDLFLDAPATEDVPDAGDAEQRDAHDADPRGEAPPAAAARGRRTLDELIVGAWEGLTAHHTVDCPVCEAAMTPRYGSGATPVGGRCRGCGATLG